MRAYFFSNMYVSGIHTGIQAGHCLDQMWSHYTDLHFEGRANARAKAAFGMLREFSRDHKTFVILNGGDHDALQSLFEFIADRANESHQYPFCFFNEPGLNNALTSVGIILPERMYDDIATAVGNAMVKAETATNDVNHGNWTAFVDNRIPFHWVIDRHYTDWEREFLKRKALCKLAS